MPEEDVFTAAEVGGIQIDIDEEEVEMDIDDSLRSGPHTEKTPTKRKKDFVSDETGDVIERPFTGRRIVAVKSRRRSSSSSSKVVQVEGSEQTDKENDNDNVNDNGNNIDFLGAKGKGGGEKNSNILSALKVNFQNAMSKK